jgi:hypothetical protein
LNRFTGYCEYSRALGGLIPTLSRQARLSHQGGFETRPYIILIEVLRHALDLGRV